MVPCPECGGIKERHIRAARPGIYRVDVLMTCPFCRGDGEVTEEVAAQWREGRRRYAMRVEAGRTLEEEAQLFGISTVEQHDIESGCQASKR
jgi:hypothetical protein